MKTCSLFCIIIGLGCGCTPADIMTSGTITVQGSDSGMPVILDEASYFMELYPRATIRVIPAGSADGLAALFNRTAQVAVTSYPIDDQARALARSAGVTPKEYKFAYDGIAVITNLRNPVARLTIGQLRAIFTGRVKNWRELGGPDLPIRVFIRPGNSGTFQYFKVAVLSDSASSSPGYTKDARPIDQTKTVVDSVMRNPGAIGYVGMAYTYRSFQPLTPDDRFRVLALARDPDTTFLTPTQETVNGKTYPLWRTLYLYTNGEPKALDAGFVTFITSTKGQKIVAADGLVPATMPIAILK